MLTRATLVSSLTYRARANFNVGNNAQAEADVRAESVSVGAHGSVFSLRIDGQRREVRLPLLARYNIENALAAAAVATAAGISHDDIAAGL